MFVRLFGETTEQQLHYLQIRVIITVICIVLAIFLGAVGAAAFALIMMFAWGWGAVKALFGITTIGAIFSGNAVLGVIMFIVYFIISYVIGIFCAALGIGRYVYLLIKKAKEKP